MPAAFLRTRLRAPLALLGCALLVGCAAPGLRPASETPHALRSVAASFELEGRLSATDGTRAANGRLAWHHEAHNDRWTVYSPLGQIVAQLDRDAAGARLTTADGRRFDAPSADALLPDLLGVQAPVDHLPAWVQAVPSDRAEIRQRDALGRPALVIDAGWRIEYPEYASAAPDAAPRRIDLSRGDARLRLIIDQWTPAP
ncbi:outer membrane lipoprotein LolB [Pseudothauera nasutitermitis]|uniref:Outer-membrane lipoprotein LolB n=1 Tax=Pseudothauera nasutitermitis TaxID=2565930 RepID=A0A4S4AV04_9RHOO|nr:lipoprotein insertase outer membrane protein LolB [Pseudothauera nasutitermitis]THF63796.1 outer membrane lipoprotein LolB [Pseudothauera nasutitermitis]